MKKPPNLMQNPIMRATQLHKLAASQPNRDGFGPDTQRQFITFELSGVNPALASWLRELPCPVIGITADAQCSNDLRQACDVILPNERKLQIFAHNINQAPLAAMVFVQHLRASETLSLQDRLTAESLAYGVLQNGPEFDAWLKTYEGRALPETPDPFVTINIDNTLLNITLNHPQARNTIGTHMRDALCEALNLAIINTDISQITLTGKGPTFSIGGALEEFGQVSDSATAHWIRSLRLPAWYLARLSDKLRVHVNGAAIGAGAEIAAFGHYVTASSKAWFQLPELKYGLIPGAGGTASIPARIGRQKTAYMALSMAKINAQTALEWGLIDEILD